METLGPQWWILTKKTQKTVHKKSIKLDMDKSSTNPGTYQFVSVVKNSCIDPRNIKYKVVFETLYRISRELKSAYLSWENNTENAVCILNTIQ